MGKGGDSIGAPTVVDAGDRPSVLEDARFLPFQQDHFNVAEFTSRVLAGSQTTAQAQSDQLREGARILDGELAQQVVQRQGPLLGNVRRMLDAEAALQDIVLSVESLQSAVKRIKAELVAPYEQVRSKTRQLRHLNATVELLRHLIHRLKLAHKLRQQLAAPAGQQDLAKAAKLVTDMQAVDREVDLSGIAAVADDDRLLRSAAASIREQAESALSEGMESLSQAKVGAALQVFFNLDALNTAVSGLMSKYVHDLERSLKAALDSRQLSGAAPGALAGAGGAAGGLLPRAGGAAGGGSVSGAAGSWQEKLWSGLAGVMDQLCNGAVAVWHLQRVVAKKKDPLTHVCFLDVLAPPGEPLLSQRFWNDVVKVLGDALGAVSKPTKGGVVREALGSHYPRLAALLEGAFERIVGDTTIKGVLPAVVPEQLHQLLGAAGVFQTVYLSSSLARMSDAVVAAFPGGTRQLPSPADVQKCIGIMHEEVKACGTSGALAAAVASTVGKALMLLAERAEYMAATGPDVRSVSSTATAAQARNIALCSQLQEVYRSMSGLLPRLPAAAAPALSAALETVQRCAIEVVAPLFRSTVEALEDRVLQLHSPDASAGSGAQVATSPYVLECVNLLATFRSEFLSKFVPPPSPSLPSCTGALVERLAARLLLFFVRHASLLRPHGMAGKLQLAKDLAELQAAVGQHLYPLEQLGAPHRITKAFRALLFQDTQGIAATVAGAGGAANGGPPAPVPLERSLSISGGGAAAASSSATALTAVNPLLRELPAGTMLQHLFSRLPAEVQAPHERASLSPAQYSLWLDTHTQDDVISGILGALDAQSVARAAADDAEAAQVLSIMKALCAGAVAAGGP